MYTTRLSRKLKENTKAEIESSEYIQALDEILACNIDVPLETLEKIVIRSIQDHSESRTYFQKICEENPLKILNILKGCNCTVSSVVVDCFSENENTLPLLKGVQQLIKDENNNNVKFIVPLAFQLLGKFNYDFHDVEFLITELPLRMENSDVKLFTLLIFTLLDKKYKERFESKFIDFIDSLIIEVESGLGNHLLLIIVDILTELYSSLTILCSRVFLGAELQQLLRANVAFNDDLAFKCLLLLSAGCIDETVRSFISENFVELLVKSYQTEKLRILSALVLVKTWSFSNLKNITIKDLTTLFINTLESDVDSDMNRDYSIEGLTYLSLKPSVRKLIRSSNDVCMKLVNFVKDASLQGSRKYGVLAILDNLSSFEVEQSPEKESIRNLRAYSDLKNPKNETEDNKEKKEDILEFNRDYILDLEVIGVLKNQFDLTQNCYKEIIRLIFNVVQDKDSISECVKQGGTVVLLDFLINSKKQNSSHILGCRTLAQILIYTNPQLIFNKYSPLTAIEFLFELIPDDEVPILEFSQEVTNKDSYEALLALTNLASMDDSDSICKCIALNPKYWSKIEACMLDNTIQIQRSVLELLSNLMAHPLHIAAKFFNFDNPKSVKNFNILLRLLELYDIQSQRAVAAIFANIAGSIPFISLELSRQTKLIETAIHVFNEQMSDGDLRQRLLYFFDSITDNIQEQEKKLLLQSKTLSSSLEKLSAYIENEKMMEYQLLKSLRSKGF